MHEKKNVANETVAGQAVVFDDSTGILFFDIINIDILTILKLTYKIIGTNSSSCVELLTIIIIQLLTTVSSNNVTAENENRKTLHRVHSILLFAVTD